MKNWFYIALICTMTAGSVLLWDSKPELLNPLAERPDSPFERFPHAVIHDANTAHFDELGRLSYEFDAVTLKHFRADANYSSEQDFMLITAPKLTLYGEPLPWFITARQGKVSDKGNRLELWDEVVVWQNTANQDEQRTQLTTNRILILPQAKRISTDAAVHIDSPNGNLTAEGLEVDMVTQRIKLLAKVRGQHEPIR